MVNLADRETVRREPTFSPSWFMALATPRGKHREITVGGARDVLARLALHDERSVSALPPAE